MNDLLEGVTKIYSSVIAGIVSKARDAMNRNVSENMFLDDYTSETQY